MLPPRNYPPRRPRIRENVNEAIRAREVRAVFPDGSVEIKVDNSKELFLYLADNGAIRAGKTALSVTVLYADGTTKEIAVERKPASGG